jgi:hypothetical protein
MRVSLRVLAGLLALSCAGCAGGPPDGAGDTAASRTPGAGDRDTVTATGPDSLRIGLDVPREVSVGHPVPIVIRLENAGTRPLDLYLRGRTIAFDIFITREKGEVVWQRLKDEIIPAIIQLKVLQPGEVLELKDEWRQRSNHGAPVGPGRYLVRAAVLTDGPAALETTSASLRIVGR